MENGANHVTPSEAIKVPADEDSSLRYRAL